MKIVEGDLLALARQARFDVIVHGCNCWRRMGAGIAKAIKAQCPAAYAADLATAEGAREKLGGYSHALIEADGARFVVVNAYTQFHWRGAGVKADYEAIAKAMRAVARDFPDARIGYPKIGAGLAGGDWAVIAPLIDAALEGRDHTLVLLPT